MGIPGILEGFRNEWTWWEKENEGKQALAKPNLKTTRSSSILVNTISLTESHRVKQNEQIVFSRVEDKRSE